MRVCGSGDVRPRRLPCRSDKAVYWQAAPPLGHATTFAAARWRRAHRGPRRGTSSCRYRCRSRRSRYWVSETWRAPCLWRPLPASLAGGAGARPDHPINGHADDTREERRLGTGFVLHCVPDAALPFAPANLARRFGVWPDIQKGCTTFVQQLQYRKLFLLPDWSENEGDNRIGNETELLAGFVLSDEQKAIFSSPGQGVLRKWLVEPP